MINFRTLLILIILLHKPEVNAQDRNDFKAGLINIGLGGIVGGLGAMVNKKPNEKTGKVFLRGFGQGALGGYFIFESKRLVGKFSKTGEYGYIWPSKIINSAGTSIIENAVANRNFWDRWHLNIGFNRVEIYTKDRFKVSYRVMPFALGSTIYGFTQGKLSFSESIKTGTFIFRVNKNMGLEGLTLSNIILLSNNKSFFTKEVITAHELIHNYQYESFSGLNSFLNKPIKNLNLNKKWSKKYHSIFYNDFNFITNGFGYILSKGNNNLFEREAQFYTEK